MLESWCLAPLALQDNLADFPQQRAQLEQLADEFWAHKDKPLDWRLKRYEMLDQHFDALESAVTLKLIESNNDPFFIRLKEAIAPLAETLAEKTNGFIEEAQARLTEASMPAWLLALLNDSEAPIIAANAPGLANGLSLDVLSKQLKQAKCLEGSSPMVLTQRLSAFDNKEIVRQLSDGMCFAVARDYFNNLISQTKMDKPISIKQLREIERTPWSMLHFSLVEGIVIVSQAFASLDERYGQKVRQAYTDGRIRLLKPGEPSMCMDTPAGSYIQLNYVNDLESLILLAHECGHLVHQEIVRERYILRQDISPLLSETIALFFEHHVACYWFEKHGLQEVLATWQKRQEIEWYHRHRLLALFEYKLYSLKEINTTAVSLLWRELNQEFYAQSVAFDRLFLESWRELTHIVNSPFYYLIYPEAFSRIGKDDIAEAVCALR